MGARMRAQSSEVGVGTSPDWAVEDAADEDEEAEGFSVGRVASWVPERGFGFAEACIDALVGMQQIFVHHGRCMASHVWARAS